MSRFVRPSHYRHVYAERSKAPYDNAKISGSAWDTNLVTAGGKYLAVNWQVSGGGAFCVLPTFSEFSPAKPEGFNPKLPDVLPLARGHTAPVLDTAWSPFDDNLVVSGGEDGKVFIWKIEDSLFDGWKEDGWEPQDLAPVGKLNAGGRKVGQVEFHPAAANVLASASGDHLLRVWDIEGSADAPSITLTGHGDSIQSLCWNSVGTLLATTCRDRKLRLFDPRAGAEAVRIADGHGGIKGSRVVWLGDRDRIATTGFSKMSDRQLSLWDTSSLTNINTESLDTSAGVVVPYFAEGNNVLFLAGKGDGNIRYYEFDNDEFHLLSEYKTSTPQRGINFLPRRALDTSQKEIARAFKLSTNSIEALSFVVPRKAEGFQSDLFPPANSDEPALSAADWFGGKTVRPNVVDLETRSVSANKAPISASTPAAAKSAPSSAAATPAPASPVVKEEAKPEPKEEPKPESKEPTPVQSKKATPAASASASPKLAPEPEPQAKDLEIEQNDNDDSDDEAAVAAAVGGGAAAAAVGAASVTATSTSAPASKPTTQPPSGTGTPANEKENGAPAPNTTSDLLIKLLSDKATLPTRGSRLSAGYDLYAAADITIPARGKALVDTQISIAVPEGTYGRIAPRSGLAAKHSIDTGAGVIDADYRGTVFVLLFNYGESDFAVSRGDRVAQLILEKVHMAEIRQVDDLEATARGAGGFGSTGGFGA